VWGYNSASLRLRTAASPEDEALRPFHSKIWFRPRYRMPPGDRGRQAGMKDGSELDGAPASWIPTAGSSAEAETLADEISSRSRSRSLPSGARDKMFNFARARGRNNYTAITERDGVRRTGRSRCNLNDAALLRE